MKKISKYLLVLGAMVSIMIPARQTFAMDDESSFSSSMSVSKDGGISSQSESKIGSSAKTNTISSESSLSSNTQIKDNLDTSSEQPSTSDSPEQEKSKVVLRSNTLFGPGYYPEDFQKKVLFSGGRNPFIKSTTSFLNGIKSGLQLGWAKHGVLPSVSAAQAILESGWGSSGLAINGKNLFGIKGTYNGQSILVSTQEWVNGHWVTINAAFRKYPSWNESVEDHGYFLASNSHYSNLIGETDYRKVTRYLYQDGYATAPNYASYLNQLIETYKLTVYDVPHIYNKITSSTIVNYGGTVTQSKRSDGLFSSGPYNTSAATLKPNASAKSYNGQKVAVSQEAVTSSGVTWVKVRLTNGQSYWLDKRGIKAYNYTKIISQKNVNYGGTITQSKRSDGLFSSGPYNTSAATLKPNASAKSYNGQKVAVSQEAVTSSGVTWVRIRLTNGQSYWLDKRGIK